MFCLWGLFCFAALRKPFFNYGQEVACKEHLGGVCDPQKYPKHPSNLLHFTDLSLSIPEDPYHGFGQANGLAFSVPRGFPVPPSLVNMLHEANAWPSSHGDLTSHLGGGFDGLFGVWFCLGV